MLLFSATFRKDKFSNSSLFSISLKVCVFAKLFFLKSLSISTKLPSLKAKVPMLPSLVTSSSSPAAVSSSVISIFSATKSAPQALKSILLGSESKDCSWSWVNAVWIELSKFELKTVISNNTLSKPSRVKIELFSKRISILEPAWFVSLPNTISFSLIVSPIFNSKISPFFVSTKNLPLNSFTVVMFFINSPFCIV